MANILIVDDMEAIRDSFEFHFRSIGWHAETASNGEEAIEILGLKGVFFDGIILDRTMPVKSGDEVVKYLFENDLLTEICVAIFTGYPDYRSAIDAMRMGAWQYLIKEDMTPSEVQTFIAPGIARKRAHRMSQDLRDARQLDQVLNRLHAIVRETLAPDHFRVIFLSEYLSASRDLSDGSTPGFQGEFVRKIMEGARFISTRNPVETARMGPNLPGAAALMAVPVRHAGGILGVLEMESLQEGAFDPRWQEVLSSFAEIITLSQEIHESIVRERDLALEREKQIDLSRTWGELAHRMGTSLSVVKQSAADLLRESLPPATGKRAQYIASHADRIEGILVELKDLSTPKDIRPALLDVAAVTAAVSNEWATYSSLVDPTLTGTKSLIAVADAEALRDALACLIKNAFEAIEGRVAKDKANGTAVSYWIGIDVKPVDEWAAITIADNGVGFEKELEERLFNPLFTTKRRRDNLNEGYGLYTCERVIKKMGGTIHGSSKGAYQGAEFTIRLPRE